MKQWSRLFYFLLLNVVVSACTTFSVLMIWDRTHSPFLNNLLGPISLKLPQISTTQPNASPATPVTSTSGVAPAITPTQEYFAYQVVDGDTFDSIAQKFNMSVEQLTKDNGFPQPVPLGPGEVLRIARHPEATAVIDLVVGVNDLATEHVQIMHRGENELSMEGWQLDDGQGNLYVFPPIQLLPGGALVVYTQPGTNTAVELHWGLNQPVWLSGKTVTLRDATGRVRQVYPIP